MISSDGSRVRAPEQRLTRRHTDLESDGRNLSRTSYTLMSLSSGVLKTSITSQSGMRRISESGRGNILRLWIGIWLQYMILMRFCARLRIDWKDYSRWSLNTEDELDVNSELQAYQVLRSIQGYPKVLGTLLREILGSSWAWRGERM